MNLEESVGFYRGYEVVIKKEGTPSEAQRIDFIKTAEYLQEKVFKNLDNECSEDLEDLLEQKNVLAKITDIVTDFYAQYNEKHDRYEA